MVTRISALFRVFRGGLVVLISWRAGPGPDQSFCLCGQLDLLDMHNSVT